MSSDLSPDRASRGSFCARVFGSKIEPRSGRRYDPRLPSGAVIPHAPRAPARAVRTSDGPAGREVTMLRSSYRRCGLAVSGLLLVVAGGAARAEDDDF